MWIIHARTRMSPLCLFVCSAEIEQKYQEIMRQAGILTLDGQVGYKRASIWYQEFNSLRIEEDT